MTQFGEVITNTDLNRSREVAFLPGIANPPGGPTGIGASPEIGMFIFAGTSDTVYFFMPFPEDMDFSVDPSLDTFWSLATAETNGDGVQLDLRYTVPVENTTGSGVDKTSTTVTGFVIATTANGLAANDMYSLNYSIPRADANNPISGGIGLAMQIAYIGTTGLGTIHMTGSRFNYRALY